MKRCSPKPTLRDRPLLGVAQASALEHLFKVLANDSRLRLLHSIARQGEICVGDLAEELAMSPQAVSNQLQRLRGIVATRRDGNSIFYRIVDPCVLILLERGLCLLEEADKRRSARRLV
jgi:ArsR family transcriptional regulator, lead/cadmium/zinc/bismuth-responsive transcriptional repressor